MVIISKTYTWWAVVVWLSWQSGRFQYQISPVRNPVIGENLFILNICLLSTVYRKEENKEKEVGNGPFLKKPFKITRIKAPNKYKVDMKV